MLTRSDDRPHSRVSTLGSIARRPARDSRARRSPKWVRPCARRPQRHNQRSRPRLLVGALPRQPAARRALHGRRLGLRRPRHSGSHRGARGAASRPHARSVHAARQRARVCLATPVRARRHIAAHYDLGNDMFRLFLDESMTYSCALFEEPGRTLHEAQIAKLDRICRKLELAPDDHLVEIGTGWGSLALHAAASTAAGSRPPPSRQSSTRWRTRGRVLPGSEIASRS